MFIKQWLYFECYNMCVKVLKVCFGCSQAGSCLILFSVGDLFFFLISWPKCFRTYFKTRWIVRSYTNSAPWVSFATRGFCNSCQQQLYFTFPFPSFSHFQYRHIPADGARHCSDSRHTAFGARKAAPSPHACTLTQALPEQRPLLHLCGIQTRSPPPAPQLVLGHGSLVRI